MGDRFYQVVLHSAPNLVQRCDLPTRADGEYVDMPQSLIDAGFDPSDRKFASMAKQQGVPVFNAVDSGWIQHAAALNAEGIVVSNLCGVNPALWFTD